VLSPGGVEYFRRTIHPEKMAGSRRRARPTPFVAKVQKIGINPYVRVPKDVLDWIFEHAKRSQSPIPVQGTLNGKPFLQTLVKYRAVWRLYLNTPMRTAAGIDVGDEATVVLDFDGRPRTTPMNPALARAFDAHPSCRRAFDALTPSRRKEILRYLNALKTEASLERTVQSVLSHLSGKRPATARAVLRAKP
jgi:hypothetical protein